MKRVIKCSEEVLIDKAISSYLAGNTKTDEVLDTQMKKLVNMYNQGVVIDGYTDKQVVAQAGEGLLEYLAGRGLHEDKFTAALNYFCQLNHNMIAAMTEVEMPGGYLGTTMMTTPSIKSNDQRNALEALEIAIAEKFRQFESFCDRQLALTSGDSWEGKIYLTEDGCYYIKLEATRADFSAFVQGDSVVRKPAHKTFVGYYDVSGTRGTVYWMSRFREKNIDKIR